ncbi:jg14357 [Pararge aegeria aegeria]|uniref:Jg14357 protein n=1 Tax=Pararge aegeria aegeria TaxID=348720 RepID=A0A8S4QJR3_9NEOP|nr:jg14357 [Pararge aegeria aegeria]
MNLPSHRTIPRISTAVDTSTLEAMGLGFTRADRSLQGEVRRSFHRPVDRADRIDRIDRANTGRSVPRNLNIASTAATAASTPEPHRLETDDAISLRSMTGRARAHSEEQDAKPKPQPEAPAHANHPTLPLTVDKVT